MDDRERLLQLWERVERELRATLALVRNDLEPDDVGQIEEFLDHNELGLAFDFLVDCLLESVVAAPREAYDRLGVARGEMQLPANAAWKRLTARFALPST